MAPNEDNGTLILPTQCVESKGAEYFFSLSVAALEHTFAVAPKQEL